MFYIAKGKEPDSLTRYRKTKFAYYDGFPEKDDIRRALLEEQGFLCAYCMRRINDIKDSTIEHYFAQTDNDDLMGLNYKYMLGVCMLTRGDEQRLQTCDVHRGKKPLTVNPWSKKSISLISYEQGTGGIFSEDKNIDNDLNYTLNLNCDNAKLPLGRLAALNSMKNFMIKLKKTGAWNRTFLDKIKKSYLSKNENGKYPQYVGILSWYINKKINISN